MNQFRAIEPGINKRLQASDEMLRRSERFARYRPCARMQSCLRIFVGAVPDMGKGLGCAGAQAKQQRQAQQSSRSCQQPSMPVIVTASGTNIPGNAEQ